MYECVGKGDKEQGFYIKSEYIVIGDLSLFLRIKIILLLMEFLPCARHCTGCVKWVLSAKPADRQLYMLATTFLKAAQLEGEPQPV